jgi:outer membrane receptor protein involved in Fe transport
MLKSHLLGATALRTFAACGLVVAGTLPAHAQELVEAAQTASAETAQEAKIAGTDTSALDCATDPSDAQCQAIVVTGSRIRRPNLDSAIPVTSVGGEELFETGNISVGDILNELPAARSTLSQANSTRGLGIHGLNLLDLRGLSLGRTLVLQNGRRHVGGDVLSTGLQVDINTMPTDLIERIDVVTGGNSAIYGSDAIAGVVNFILKDDYEGAQLRGQGGISRYEDAGAFFIAGLAGTNFADGRGNIAVNLEYARQRQYFGDPREFIRENDAFVIVDSDPAGSPNGADNVFDRQFLRDIRSATLSNTGLVRFGGVDATGANSPLGCGKDLQGTNYNCTFIFDTDGKLGPQTGTRVGLGPNGVFLGGNGDNFRDSQQIQLSPDLRRINFNIFGHYEISPAMVPFVEAKYSRTRTRGTGSQGPAFITGGTLGDPLQFITGRNREAFRLDNPFLDPAARALIVAQRALNGQSSSNSTQVALRENLLGLGVRNEQAERHTYRIVGGFRGTFNTDWSYEVSANYGRLDEKTSINGNLDIQRFLLAMDAARDPVTNQIVCKSKFDAASAVGYVESDPNGAAKLADDIAKCIPLNPFGGNFTQAQRDYVLQDTVSKGRTSQLDLLAFMSGDTSGFLNLWGGPIGFAIGAEYRKENVFYQQGDLVELGYTFYNAIPTFKAPKNKVKEAFGEIRLPILKDKPLFEELTVSAAGRVSEYSIGDTGTVYAYNAGIEWSPVDSLRLRGNYSRSVRAPNQVELFSPQGQNFAPGFVDPCSKNNIGTGSPNRAANCSAAGIPADYNFIYSQSLETVSGSNPDLREESADSYTLGGVFTPAFLPGFTFSADYYDITLRDAIQTLSAQQIANSCYDGPSLSNPFCSLFERAGSGGGPNGEVPFQIIEGSLLQAGVNFAKLTARGIDIEAAYHGRLFNLGQFDTRLIYTHALERSNFIDPADPKRENVVLSELGDPVDAFNWNSSLKTGRFTFGYEMRFIGKMFVNTFEDFNNLQDRPPENADFAEIRKFREAFYHDVRVGVDIGKQYNFYLGADNLTNTKPRLGTTGIGAGSAIWDNKGRYYYAGFTAKF